MAASTFPAIEALGEIVDALKQMHALDLSLMTKVDLIRRSMVSPQLKEALQELLGDIRIGVIYTDGLDQWVAERADVLQEWMDEGAAATRHTAADVEPAGKWSRPPKSPLSRVMNPEKDAFHIQRHMDRDDAPADDQAREVRALVQGQSDPTPCLTD